MADMGLARRSSLAGLAMAGRHGRSHGPAGVHIRIVNEFAAFYISARKGHAQKLAQWFAEIFAGDVPDAPRRVARGDLSITGLSPGQWRIVARGGEARARAQALIGITKSFAISVECGDGLLLAEVSGEKAGMALAKGVPVDLDAAVFRPGDAAQTAASHIGLHIAAIDVSPTYELIAPASSAESLWSWLRASCAEYGYEVIND